MIAPNIKLFLRFVSVICVVRQNASPGINVLLPFVKHIDAFAKHEPGCVTCHWQRLLQILDRAIEPPAIGTGNDTCVLSYSPTRSDFSFGLVSKGLLSGQADSGRKGNDFVRDHGQCTP